MRVVLDTNVIVSGLLSKGPASEFFDLIEEGAIELCLTPRILDELSRVFTYPKIAKILQSANVVPEEAIEWLLKHGSVFQDHDHVSVVEKDPSDDVFINCALTSEAQFIISGDKHLRRVGSYRSIQILSPREFLSL